MTSGAHRNRAEQPRARRTAIAAAVGLLAVAAGPGAAADTAPDTGLDAVMQLLAARRHGDAHFTQRQYLAVLDRPLVSSGELHYDAPDRLQQRTLQPRAQTFTYDAGQIQVQRGARSYQLDAQRYAQLLPLLESLRATLAGDRAALQRSFRLDFHGSVTGWTLQLVPRDTRVSARVTDVRIEGVRGDLRRVEVRERDGDRSVTTIEPVAP